jgi:hypothetical protein
MAAECLPLTAKVADFGLALPLGHMDTHATMLARVSSLVYFDPSWVAGAQE